MTKNLKPSWMGLTTSDDGVAVNEIVDPVKFQRWVEGLEKQRGKIDPREMWESIQDKPKHPVYPAYEWRDEVAAARYRDEQSRLMIRKVVVRVIAPDESHYVQRAIVSRPDPSEQDLRHKQYNSFASQMKDRDAMEYQLEECLKQLRLWRRKWRVISAIAEVAPQLEVIDGVIRVMEEQLAGS